MLLTVDLKIYSLLAIWWRDNCSCQKAIIIYVLSNADILFIGITVYLVPNTYHYQTINILYCLQYFIFSINFSFSSYQYKDVHNFVYSCNTVAIQDVWKWACFLFFFIGVPTPYVGKSSFFSNDGILIWYMKWKKKKLKVIYLHGYFQTNFVIN